MFKSKDERGISNLITTLILVAVAIVGGAFAYTAFRNQAQSVGTNADVMAQVSAVKPVGADNATVVATVKNTGTVALENVELVFPQLSEDNCCGAPLPYVYSGTNDLVLRKTDSEGNELWTSFFPEGAPITGVATDSDSYVYFGDGYGDVRKITPEGDTVWTFSASHKIKGIEVGPMGNIHFGTLAEFGGNSGSNVRKISPEGDEIWNFPGHSDTVTDVAVGSDGYVYSVSLDGTTRKISPDGNEVWSFTGVSYPYSMAVDSNGYVYVGGYTAKLVKLDSSGNEVWTVSTISSVEAASVGRDDQVYIGDGSNVKKISPEGDEIWTYSGHSGTVLDIALDSDGNVYSSAADGTVRKIDPSGNEAWVYMGDAGSSTNVYGVAVSETDGRENEGSISGKTIQATENSERVKTGVNVSVEGFVPGLELGRTYTVVVRADVVGGGEISEIIEVMVK